MNTRERKSDWIEGLCTECKGTGRLVQMRTPRQRFEPKINPNLCPVCHGTGRLPDASKALATG